MKTINAVTNALYRCCKLELRECDGCPYREFGDMCATELAGDAEYYLYLRYHELKSSDSLWDHYYTKGGNMLIRLRQENNLPCDDNGLLPFFIEHRDTGEINAGIYDKRNDQIYYDMGEAMSEWIDTEGQGVTWRAWATRPTDRERAAARWEEREERSDRA